VCMNKDKLHETICALLNSKGGYIVIGVRDDGFISGVDRKVVDFMSLMVDDIHHRRIIIRNNDTPLLFHNIKAEPIIFSNKTLVKIVVQPDEGELYRLKSGDIFIRLSASNYHLSTFDGCLSKSEAENYAKQVAANMLLEATTKMKRDMTNRYIAISKDAKNQLLSLEEERNRLKKEREAFEAQNKILGEHIESLRGLLFSKILREKEQMEEVYAPPPPPSTLCSFLSSLFCLD